MMATCLRRGNGIYFSGKRTTKIIMINSHRIKWCCRDVRFSFNLRILQRRSSCAREASHIHGQVNMVSTQRRKQKTFEP